MKRVVCLMLGCVLQVGCTFYTSCPTPDPGKPSNTAGTGGTANNAGGGQGGSSPMEPNPAGGAGEIVIPGTWEDATGDLVGLKSGCGNVMYLAAKPGTDKMIAGVVSQGLWETTDGETWQHLGEGKGSATIENVVSSITFDPDDPDVFWESGLYIGPAMFRTDDGGETFVELTGTVGHNTTLSVDFTDPDRKTLLAASHEKGQTLYLSKDGGTSWDDIGMKFPPEAIYCDYVHVLDAQTFLVGCTGYGDGDNGIYRSEDAGGSWERVSEPGGYLVPLVGEEGRTLYWQTLNFGGMVKSSDQGITWQVVADGPFRVRPVELPDGRIVAISKTHMLISDDQADSWRSFGPAIPDGFSPEFFAYSPEQGAFYVGAGKCDDNVQAGIVQRLEFDYKKF